MITRAKWIEIVKRTAKTIESSGSVYGWGGPVTMAGLKKKGTCVTFVAVCLQEAGLLPSGKYLNFQTTGNLHGTGAAYVRSHSGIYQVIENVNKRPQAAGLQVGDIVGYKSHIMIFAGWDSKKRPLWFSLERGAGGIGHKPRIDIAERFPYYDTRAINGGIVRLKFDDSATKPQTSTNVSKPAKTVKWKLKTAMNMRDKANGSKIICRIPQGAVLTQQSKSGYWIKTTYCGETGWVCCGTTKYASKV